MQWTDEAIVLSAKKYGESSGIVTLLTRQYGLHKGLVRGIMSKKQCGIYQVGNLIEATWRGRLSEQLGNFTAELIKSNAAILMQDSLKLSGLAAICSVLESTLQEREESFRIFNQLQSLVEVMKEDGNWQKYYVMMEIELLSYLGFGLDLESCAATGEVDNLHYLSPKSGRAVCRDAGEPYKDKLFIMPSFLKNGVKDEKNAEEIRNGLEICSYFLEKYIYKPHNARLPMARMRLAELIKEKELA